MQKDFYVQLNQLASFENIKSENAPSKEVIKLIVDTINEYSHSNFVKLVIDKLNYGNPSKLEFVKRIFDYVCSQVEYLRDPAGHEIIFTPKLLIKRGKGDCKKFTTFLGSVLKAAGFDPVLKVVAYSNTDWQHIYITVKVNNEVIILDPVNQCLFNKEVKHFKAQEFFLNGKKSNIMNGNKLSQMGNIKTDNLVQLTTQDFLNNAQSVGNSIFSTSAGVGCCMGENETDFYLSGLEEDYIGRKKLKDIIKDTVQKVKDKVKVIFKAGKKVGFAPMRAAFLGMLLLGKALEKSPLKLHLPHKLVLLWNKDNGKTLSKMWSDFGGDPAVLGKTILKGSTAGMHGANDLEFDTLDIHSNRAANISGMGIVTVASVSMAIATATPLIVASLKLLKQSGLLKPHEAKTLDAVVESAADIHDATGSHPDIKDNDIVNNGAAQGDTGHPGGSPTAGSVINFMQPFALNTWFKAWFLFGLYAALNQNHFAQNIATGSLIILIFLSIKRIFTLKK